MANLIIVSGPQAVGKMTVAENLRDKIGYSLMVNHDSIEISDKIFKRGSEAQKELKSLIREDVFNLALKHDIDMIFTLVVAFDVKEETDYLNSLKNRFEASGGKFYFVELRADIETRLKRNITPHRLEAKPTKKDLKWSKRDLLDKMEKYKLNTDDGEILFENHIKIDNTNLSPDEVTEIIIEKFKLKRIKRQEEVEK